VSSIFVTLSLKLKPVLSIIERSSQYVRTCFNGI